MTQTIHTRCDGCGRTQAAAGDDWAQFYVSAGPVTQGPLNAFMAHLCPACCPPYERENPGSLAANITNLVCAVAPQMNRPPAEPAAPAAPPAPAAQPRESSQP